MIRDLVTRTQLGHSMKVLRLAIGMSEEELASLTGISRQSLSTYETATAVPRMINLIKWLSAVSLVIEYMGDIVHKYDRKKMNAMTMPNGSKIEIKVLRRKE